MLEIYIWLSSTLLFLMYMLFVLFWNHTLWYSGITPGGAWDPYMMVGKEPGQATYKANILPGVYPLGP